MSNLKPIQIIFLFFLIFQTTLSVSQELQEEDILENQEELDDQSDLIELLEFLKINPLDLNRTDLQQLQQIPQLTPVEARAIIDYRDQMGGFKSVDDLKNIPGFSSGTFHAIRDYITIIPLKSDKGRIQLRSRTRLKQRIEKAEGFKSGIYPNSPEKFYNRFDMKAFEKIDATFLIEKDSGENQWNDLALFYLRLHALPWNTQILLGNYSLEVGQGLVLWGPTGYSKGIDPITPAKRRPRNLKPYTSVNENAAFYGMAVQTQTKWIDCLAFISQNKLDATVADDTVTSSIYTSGLHRTSTELEKKDRLTEKIIGARCQFHWQNYVRLGTTAYRSIYNQYISSYDWLRQRFAFQGKQNRLIAFDFDIYYEHINLFSEVAQSQNGKTGVVSGAIINVGELAYSILYRNYDKAFLSLHGHGCFRLSGSPQNETGIFTGLRYRLFHTTDVTFYYDWYKFPWRRYYQEMPSQGEDFSLNLTQRLSQNWTLRLRWRAKIEDESVEIVNRYGIEKKPLVAYRRRSIRFQMDYRISAWFLFRNRIEKCWVDYLGSEIWALPDNSGIILYQDTKYMPTPKLSIQGRLCFFDTDSYKSRIYVFENDLPGTINNRMFVGRGTYWYILFSYNYLNRIRIHLKYSSLYKDDDHQFGSGSDSVISDTLHDLAIQIETRF